MYINYEEATRLAKKEQAKEIKRILLNTDEPKVKMEFVKWWMVKGK
jgi:hypothetical protein